ncbi:MAG TPA: MFS transporter [Stellaceae bacterium]|nr:MFS transporter [Stellaceae bacterium]
MNAPVRSGVFQARAAWTALAFVCAIAIINYTDRMTLAAMVPRIKAEFGSTDSQIGWLSASFALVYSICGLPLARWADVSSSRRAILGITAALWSIMTAACGLAQSYGMLFAARCGVAVGEAGQFPAAYSMLSDYFPAARRNFAIGTLIASSALGVVGGLALGGWLASAIGWRGAFIVIGLPGVVLALLAYVFVREPLRGAFDHGQYPLDGERSLWTTFTTLLRNRLYVLLTLTAGFNGYCAIGMVQWLPSYFDRTFHLPLATIGLLFGTAFGLGLGAGQLAGAVLAARLARRSIAEPLKLCALSNTLIAPGYLMVLCAPTAGFAIMMTLVTAVIAGLGHASQAAGTQNAVPPRLRGAAHGILSVLVSGIGMGVGPLMVGVISDRLQPTLGNAEALRYALCISQILHVTAAFTAWAALLTARRSVATAPAPLAAIDAGLADL